MSLDINDFKNPTDPINPNNPIITTSPTNPFKPNTINKDNINNKEKNLANSPKARQSISKTVKHDEKEKVVVEKKRLNPPSKFNGLNTATQQDHLGNMVSDNKKQVNTTASKYRF